MTKHPSQIDNHFCPGRQQGEGFGLVLAVFVATCFALVLGAWALSSNGGL
jgi:hypothetical protein